MKLPSHSPLGIALGGGPFLVMMILVLAGASQTLACVGALGTLLAVGVIFVMRTTTSMRQDDLSTFAPPDVVDVGAAAEAALRSDDPGFSKERLLERATALVSLLDEAHLEEAHPFLSDGLYQRLRTQARLFPGALALSGARVSSALISGYLVSSSYNHLAVRVTQGLGAEGRTHSLSFLRRRGAHTTVVSGERRCPNCAAPLELGSTGRCRFCEAIVNSGAHDWVLCELSPGAHQLGRQAEVFDPDQLRVQDPALAGEELEDRAALTFWRWVEARRAGAPGRLARVATPSFIELLDTAVAPGLNVLLGEAELRSLRRQAAFDEAAVLLRWSDESDEGVRAHQTIFKLRRPGGLTTQPTPGLSTFRCARCLAAVTDAETPACEFCGASFVDGWQLHSLEPFAAWASEALALRKQVGGDWVRVATEPQREAALRLLVALARADGTVTDAERTSLEALGARWQLPTSLVQSCIASAAQAQVPQLSRELALTLTQELAELAFVEHHIAPQTRKRLEAAAEALGTRAELTRALAARIAARCVTPSS